MVSIVSQALSSLKNAGMVRNSYTYVPYSGFVVKLLDIFYSEGFINGYSFSGNKIKVYITYMINSDLAVIGSLKQISRPGRRKYITYNQLIQFYSGRFIILSTSKGVVTGTEAIKFKVGGELIVIKYYF